MARGRAPVKSNPGHGLAPGVKQERVWFAGLCIKEGLLPSECTDKIARFFHLSEKQAWSYLQEAREVIRQDLNASRDALKDQSIVFYSHFASNKHIEPVLRLKARVRMDKMLGIEPISPISSGMQVNVQTNQVNSSTGETAREQRIHDLNIMWSRMAIEKAKTYGFPLPDDLQELANKQDEIKGLPAAKLIKKK